MPGGLLIVNADDWGRDARTTDAILECFRAGAIGGASAMVYMEDSDRAAALARSAGLPVGLHLNLIRPYTDPRTPDALRARQRRLTGYLTRSRWRRWVPNPTFRSAAARCVADQRERFEELYGREPTHVDGEQHMHTWPTALRALPRAQKLRPTFTWVARERAAPNRVARALFNRALRRRFATPDYFFSIRELDPRFGGAGLDERLELARHVSVEIMVHPGWDDERTFLLSDTWSAAIRGLRLGSYADLAALTRP